MSACMLDMHVCTHGQFCLPENVVDLGCLTQLPQEIGGVVITTFTPATYEESDFIIINWSLFFIVIIVQVTIYWLNRSPGDLALRSKQ